MFRTAIIAATLAFAGPAFAETAAKPVGDRVEVNGMQMYYEVSGAGEPLVVLHGAYMNIETMGGIVARLAETHKVYALEFQGHGRTTDIDRPITYPNLADDVAVFMDKVGIEKADVFAYSMGAAAGLQLAIRHPEKVNRLAAASVAYDASGWQPVDPDSLQSADFARVLDERGSFQILLVGTGKELKPLPKVLRQALKEAGISAEPMATVAAVRTYNVLIAEDRAVAAALVAVD